MEIKYIDIHSHLNFDDYKKYFSDVLKRMSDDGVGTIVVGTDLKSSQEAVKIASENENIWACIGVHPTEHGESIFDDPSEIKNSEFHGVKNDFAGLVKNPKVVAIGECGLDYFRLEDRLGQGESLTKAVQEEKDRQKKEFIKQIEFAIKYDKPLMLHIRDAHDDAYEILKKYPKARGNLHFFTGSSEIAKKFIDLGFTPTPTLVSRCFAVIRSFYIKFLSGVLKKEIYINQRKTIPKLVSGYTVSFPGVITFAKETQEAVKNIPLDKIHAETDSPFATPVPYRGKRNEPTYVIEVVKKIAELRREDEEKVRLQLLENAKRVFGI